MKSICVNGTWELRHEALSVTGEVGLTIVQEKTQGWLAAAVPGEVHLDLVNAGQMEEPLFSTNAPACRWPEDRSWWYRRAFTVDAEFLAEERQEIVFHGLDYYAQVYLNGEFIGEAENAFVPAIFDVKHKLRDENELVVRLTVGTERAKAQKMGEDSDENIYGNRQSFAGTPELRKPQFTYGWDWVDALPNIGIWRDVELRGYTHLRLFDVRTNVALCDDVAVLDVVADVENIHPWKDNDGVLRLTLTSPSGETQEQEVDVRVPAGITRATTRFRIENPELWWPNGMGEQPLYTLAVSACKTDVICDVWSREIGLRTVAIDRSPLPEGSRFCIQVNGEDVFCRGGNWIPADAIIARVDKDRYDTLIGNARDANMNMLRVWGGGIYESEHFYNACDQMGILVWQDFMFACHTYPDTDIAFQDKVRREAEAAVRRLRHHPSIALWCANNEITWGFKEWWGNDEFEYPDPRLKLGGRIVFSRILPQICMDLDPNRPYWPGSPAGGESPESETEGDTHWWEPGTMNDKLERRYRHEIYDECKSRFVSEYGVIGPCHLESNREFLRPDEINVDHNAWKIHTNLFDKETTPAAICYHYAEPEELSIEDTIRYGQMFQGVLYGRSIESMRFRKLDPEDDCAGALIWMVNDCWGETGWTPIDYYLRRKASYYWIKRACAPVRAIVRRRGSNLVTRVVNDTLTPRSLTVTCGYVRVDGSASELLSREIEVAANGMREVARDAIPLGDKAHDEWIFVAYCEGEGVAADPCVWTLVPHRRLKLCEPRVNVKTTGRTIELSSPVYCHGVRHHDAGKAMFSDNYFDLIPGVPKMIDSVGDMPSQLKFEGLQAKT
jgi:beta-mannosidase